MWIHLKFWMHWAHYIINWIKSTFYWTHCWLGPIIDWTHNLKEPESILKGLKVIAACPTESYQHQDTTWCARRYPSILKCCNQNHSIYLVNCLRWATYHSKAKISSHTSHTSCLLDRHTLYECRFFSFTDSHHFGTNPGDLIQKDVPENGEDIWKNPLIVDIWFLIFDLKCGVLHRPFSWLVQ